MDQTTCAPRKCKKCGKEIESGKYCGVCKAKVGEHNKKIGMYTSGAVATTLGVIVLKVIVPATKKVAKAAAKKAIETVI